MYLRDPALRPRGFGPTFPGGCLSVVIEEERGRGLGAILGLGLQ